jgi:hypothetical protein
MEAGKLDCRPPDRQPRTPRDQRVRVGGESEGSFCSGVVNLSSLDIRSRDRSITAFDSLIALRLMSIRSWKSSSTDRRFCDCKDGGGCLGIGDSPLWAQAGVRFMSLGRRRLFSIFADDKEIMRASWVKFPSLSCRAGAARRRHRHPWHPRQSQYP